MGYFEKLNYIAIEPNSYCNLHCLSCNRDRLAQEGQRVSKNMSLTELRSILDQIQQCPIDTIKFQILSEPMFHPTYDILVQELRKYFKNAKIIVATNLQYDLLKTPFLQTLPHIDMMYLSIDGTGEIYEKLRRGAIYSKLLKSLEIIRKHVSDIDKKKLHINFTLSPENYLELPAIYKLKDEYQLESVRINLIQNWNEDELNSHFFNDNLIEYLKPYIKDIKGVANWDYKDCFWPYTGLTIDVYGNVRQCIINTTQSPIGNVFKTPLKSIFNDSPILNNARTLLAKNIPPSSCKNCDYKHLEKTIAKIFTASDSSFGGNQPRQKGI